MKQVAVKRVAVKRVAVKRGRGFTLLEVMIALTLLSVMMVAILSSLRTFANTKTTIDRMTGRVDEIRLVTAFLRRSMEAAMTVGGAGGGEPTFDSIYEDSTYFFSGTFNEMTWVAPLSGGSGFSGVNILHLSREGGGLALRWKPYQQDADFLEWQDLKARILLEDVEQFQLAYRQTYGGDWMSEWDDSLGSPVSVRMNIKANGKYWPELVMRLN